MKKIAFLPSLVYVYLAFIIPTGAAFGSSMEQHMRECMQYDTREECLRRWDEELEQRRNHQQRQDFKEILEPICECLKEWSPFNDDGSLVDVDDVNLNYYRITQCPKECYEQHRDSRYDG